MADTTFPEITSKFEILKNYTIGKLDRSETGIMPHQHKALQLIANFYLNKNGHGLIVMPTGTGKSAIALLSPYILGVKNKVLIITPTKTISKQLSDDVTGTDIQQSLYVRLGIISQNLSYKYLPAIVIQENKSLVKLAVTDIIIANAQKFKINSPAVDEDGNLNTDFFPVDAVDLLIVDEAHHYPAVTWRRIVNHYRNKKVLFLTATPYRRGTHLQKCDEIVEKIDLIFRFPRAEAVENGVIRSLEWRSFDTPDKFEWDLIQHLNALNERINGVFKYQAMAMVKTIAECVKCAERLQYNGISSKPYYGEGKETNLTEFKKGKLQLLVVCGKLLEGFDHPKVCICAFMYETKSYVRFSQFAGRCIRIDRNNPDLIRAFLFGPKELTTFFNRLNNEENGELPVEEPSFINRLESLKI